MVQTFGHQKRALSFRHVEGLSFVDPRTELGLAGSFLQMLDDAEPNPVITRVSRFFHGSKALGLGFSYLHSCCLMISFCDVGLGGSTYLACRARDELQYCSGPTRRLSSRRSLH